MHVLVTVNSAWNVFNFRRPVIDALLQQGHRVTVLAPFDEAVTSLEEWGCEFIKLNMDVKGLSLLNDLSLLWRMLKVFAKKKPDIVLSYTIKNNIFGAIASRCLRVPFIPNVTGLGTAFLGKNIVQSIVELLYRYAFKGLPTVFFQNSDDRDLFVSRKLITAEQAELLPGSGIDLVHFSATPMPNNDGQVAFLMIARLLRDKGVIEYVDAARSLRATGCNARFCLLGAMGSKNRTAIASDTVKEWVQEGIIEYLGEVSDVRPQIASADCIVLPSYREGAPRTLIEGAAMARPLIATDVPGCRDIVEDKRTGFLCVARDSASLATALKAFLALSQDERVVMGEAGRRRIVQFYDQAYVVSAYEKAIRTMIKGNHHDQDYK